MQFTTPHTVSLNKQKSSKYFATRVTMQPHTAHTLRNQKHNNKKMIVEIEVLCNGQLQHFEPIKSIESVWWSKRVRLIALYCSFYVHRFHQRICSVCYRQIKRMMMVVRSFERNAVSCSHTNTHIILTLFFFLQLNWNKSQGFANDHIWCIIMKSEITKNIPRSRGVLVVHEINNKSEDERLIAFNVWPVLDVCFCPTQSCHDKYPIAWRNWMKNLTADHNRVRNNIIC